MTTFSLRAGLLCGAALSLVLPAQPVFGQDALDLGTVLLPRSKREVQTGTATAQTVVDQEEIEDRQASTIADLIDSVPGVSFINGSSPSGSGINIRGFGANSAYGSDQKVGIIVDGASAGAEELYRIGTQLYTDPELYKQVTVVRGSAGTFEYGSGMIGGLVKLETKDASDFTGGAPGVKLRQTLQYSSNGDEGVSSTILAWQPTREFELLGNYTWRSYGVPVDGAGDDITSDGSTLPSWALKGKYTFGAARNQYLSLSLADTESEELDVPYNSRAVATDSFGNVDRRVRSRTAVLTYGFDAPGTDLINLTAQLSHADQDIDSSYVEGSSPLEGTPSEPTVRALGDADNRYRTTKFTLKNQALFDTGAASHDLRVGLERIRKIRADNPDASASGGTDWRWALFAVDDIRFGKSWTVTPALRYEQQRIGGDGYDSFDSDAVMGGVTLRYAFSNGWAVFGSGSYTENLPILDDLGTVAYMEQSEKAETYELGFSYDRTSLVAAGDSLAVKLNAYDTRVWDVTSYSGLDRVHLQGLELEAAYSLAGGLYVDLAANAMRGQGFASGRSSGDDFQGIPADTLRLTLGKRWGEELDTSWEMVAAADMDDWTTPTPGYAEHNLRATWSPQAGALAGSEIRFGLENAFDREYRQHLSENNAAGRTFKLTLARTF
ncbi:MAG TPA: ligand-gated channel [Citreicella sp.]|nr:ligand-gated channel [Citreicella sp.]